MAKHQTGLTLGNHPELYPYLLDHIREDDIQRSLRAHIETKERSGMAGAPDEAAFFQWLLPLLNARLVVEVGSFRGSTTLALAKGLPSNGLVYALDISEDFLATGRDSWKAAGVEGKIRVLINNATASMETMVAEGMAGTIDFVFIDADKANYGKYYELALQLLRSGGVIAVDNTLWSGLGLCPKKEWDADTAAIMELNEKIKKDTRVAAVMIPLADGVYMCRKL